jgi:hypothetical protein
VCRDFTNKGEGTFAEKYFTKNSLFIKLVVLLHHENNNNTDTIAATELSEVNGYVLKKYSKSLKSS